MSASSLRSASPSATRRSRVSFSSRSARSRAHPLRRLGASAEHAGDPAVVAANRRVRKREPRLLVVAPAVHHERQILAIGGLARHRGVDERADVGPDLGPDVVEPAAECARMLRAEDLGVRIVVEKAEVLPPGDEHRKPRLQKQADDGSQRMRPLVRVPERRARPVVVAHQRADAAAPLQELQRSAHFRLGHCIHDEPDLRSDPTSSAVGRRLRVAIQFNCQAGRGPRPRSSSLTSSRVFGSIAADALPGLLNTDRRTSM